MEQGQVTALVKDILENEKALEDRIAREHQRLSQELRVLGRETRMKSYLEQRAVKGKRVNLKK